MLIAIDLNSNGGGLACKLEDGVDYALPDNLTKFLESGDVVDLGNKAISKIFLS